jgi:hypothetical protein
MERLVTNQRTLLEENTQLTKQVHDLAVQIHDLLGREGAPPAR